MAWNREIQTIRYGKSIERNRKNLKKLIKNEFSALHTLRAFRLTHSKSLEDLSIYVSLNNYLISIHCILILYGYYIRACSRIDKFSWSLLTSCSYLIRITFKTFVRH
jgi:hypothetical protein